jgi:hypothetical protein
MYWRGLDPQKRSLAASDLIAIAFVVVVALATQGAFASIRVAPVLLAVAGVCALVVLVIVLVVLLRSKDRARV